ncbi:MAG: thioredoxin domain-containing protein, partial [Cyanobacteria bacterium P01_F01_bin.42]
MSLNRLAQSPSLYLQKHATNPIQWWPWCEEALTLARARDRPIFLSVGYSSCHWCTVMEGEAFSDQAIADYLNQHFVPIKVDREERPDIDSLYMQSLQAMTGQGGWPMNMFIAPDDGIPFYGGTYFPIDARYGRPGFLQVLAAVLNFYQVEKTQLATQKQQMFEHLEANATASSRGDLTKELLSQGMENATTIIHNQTPGPNFPMMPYGFASLQSIYLPSQQEFEPLGVAEKRGLDLALGGIYDHVGGGFHRYTVDPTWTVPHFEKMLYDNGQVLEYLANLWSAGVRDMAVKRAIEGTVSWLGREMTDSSGFFYAAQDADNFTTADASEPEEGDFYVWRYEELQSLLEQEELQALAQDFHISEAGNFEGATVLQRQQGGALQKASYAALEKLFVARYGQGSATMTQFPPARGNKDAKENQWPGRIPPVTDTKMIVAWNSLVISGLARTAAVLNSRRAYDVAIAAAQFIDTHQWRDDQLLRVNYGADAAVAGQSEDYAC